MQYEFIIDTDHFQFYVEADGSTADFSLLWNKQNTEDMLALGPGVIAVGTARYGGPTKVIVEVAETRPADSFDVWDQVAECSIDVPSGILIVSSAESYLPDAPRIEIRGGTYRAMIYYGNLDSVVDDVGLEGEDYYRIVLWPGESSGPVIHKRASPSARNPG